MRTLVILCSLLLPMAASTQTSVPDEPVFGLSAVIGVNASQIDGDNFTGFNKTGIVAGLKGIARMSKNFEGHVELLFSQKGSKFASEASSREGTRDRAIKLNYAEVPILLAYRTDPGINGGRLRVEAGISVARLLDATIKEPVIGSEREFDYDEVKDDFKATDLNIIVGGYAELNESLGIGLRYSGALSKFYENPNPVSSGGNGEVVEFLRNYQLSALLTYRF